MSEHPSYCCQNCGSCIGWIGRGLQIIGLSPHACEQPRVIHRTYRAMTPEEVQAFDKVFEKMDAAFDEMGRAFKVMK